MRDNLDRQEHEHGDEGGIHARDSDNDQGQFQSIRQHGGRRKRLLRIHSETKVQKSERRHGRKEIPVERERVENNLQAGNPIIALMGPGEFTSNGHFIVLTGLQNGRLKINDPNSRKNSEKTWDIDQVLEQTKAVWVYYK